MNKLEFMTFLKETENPAAIYYELARQEAETNSLYSMALTRIQALTSSYIDYNLFDTIMPEEGKHIMLFTERAAELNEMDTAEDFKIERLK